jgi:hypothetical protein
MAADPSGLFPSGPPRRAYREPHPVRVAPLFIGIAAGTGWILLVAALGGAPRAHAWWTVGASTAAWAAALALARYGNRGVAVGVALAGGAGWTAVVSLVALYWMATGDFPLW